MPRHTIANTTLVLTIVTMVLLGLSSVLYASLRDFKSTVYDRCVATKPGNDAANDFRVAQVEAFQLITRSPRIDPQTRKLYQELADKGQLAVGRYRPVDCEIYR